MNFRELMVRPYEEVLTKTIEAEAEAVISIFWVIVSKQVIVD